MRSDRYADYTTEPENTAEYLEDDIETSAVTEADPIEEQEAEEHKSKGIFGRKNRAASDADEQSHDLSKMKKKDLLEIMLAQGKEIDALRAKVADLEAQLAKREFDIEKAGSIAEASLAVTNIFKEAEEAAKIYLENIRRHCE